MVFVGVGPALEEEGVMSFGRSEDLYGSNDGLLVGSECGAVSLVVGCSPDVGKLGESVGWFVFLLRGLGGIGDDGCWVLPVGEDADVFLASMSLGGLSFFLLWSLGRGGIPFVLGFCERDFPLRIAAEFSFFYSGLLCIECVFFSLPIIKVFGWFNKSIRLFWFCCHG